MRKRIFYLCTILLVALSLAACKGQADEQDSQPPAIPTETPAPTSPIPYTDVPADADYYDAVVWAYKKGITSDGPTFDPDSPCNRGQAITFLWRAMGSPEPQTVENPISDISPSDWYYKPVLWAYEKGIATGDTFRPNDPCTNAEALTLLWRAEGEPMAAVYGSTVALAAPGAYYAKPAAWADSNGLFAQIGAAFDPAAPSSRAYLISCLYWAEVQWASAEDVKALQAEYEQIIRDTPLYEIHGSGLLYADYVDVDNDGQIELLTVDSGNNLSDIPSWPSYEVTATIYANINGHAGNVCEQTFEFASRDCSLYTYVYDGHVYIRYEVGIYGPHNTFYKIENGAFILSEQIDEEMGAYYINSDEVSETEYNVAMSKYTNQKELFWHSKNDVISVVDRGLLPGPDEYLTQLFPVEDRAVQAEYEQIIRNAQLYEIHGSGLCYADYVDVDRDGKADLLTLAVGGDAITAAVYTNNGGHAMKAAGEAEFECLGGELFSMYKSDSQPYLCCFFSDGLGEGYDFYKIGSEGLTFEERVIVSLSEDIPDSNAEALQKYKYRKNICQDSFSGTSIIDRGLLPSPEEYAAALAKQWEAESGEIYAAVRNGDFSFFAGTYKGQVMDQNVTWVLDKNGLNGKKPFFVTVSDDGTIHCDVEPGEYLHEDGSIYEGKHPALHYGIYYELYPIGVNVSDYDHDIDLDKVRIHYIDCDGGIMDGWLTKVS